MGQTFFDRIKSQVQTFWDESVMGNRDEKGYQPAPVDAANALISEYGLHSILKYDQFDDETGLFFNDNSVSFCFEVIPQTGADENMAQRLNTLFSPIPPYFGIQWCMFATPRNDDNYDAYVELRRRAVSEGLAPDFFVDLANRRVEHVRKSAGQPLYANDNYVIKTTRLVFSVTKSGSYRDTKLVEEMHELKESLRGALRSSNLPSFSMDAQALILFLWPALNPECMFTTDPMPPIQYDDGKSIKHQMTRFGQHVRVKSNEIVFGLPPENESFEDKRVAVRAFSVLQYPKKKELWEMASIIGSFFDDSLQYPCPFMVCGGIYTLDPTMMENKSQLKSARAKMNAQSKMAPYQPELESQNSDWQIVMHQLNEGGTLCEIYHTLILFAPIKRMNRASQIAINIWRSERFTICPTDMLNLPLLYMSLPMTLTESVRGDAMKMRVSSTKTTVNAVDMSPVIGEWRGAGDPVLMLFGRRGSPTFVDYYANQQGNYNLFVTGTSGSGKSVFLNETVSAYRGVGARVWVIDVGRSYQNLIRLQNGTFIEFTPTSDLCINPFSWVGQDEENDFKSEMKMLKPMIGRMASPNAPLNEFQYALIAEAITAVWNDYGPETNPTKIRDYMLKNIKDENGKTERVAFELAKQLQPFTVDGVFGSYFNGPANIRLDGDMIGLELEELKALPDLRRVVLFVLTSRIAHDMYLSRTRKKLCLVDEAWQLLGSDKETAEFIEEGYRRARKYKGIFAVGTQGISDAFANDASRAAYKNADWKVYLRQDPKTIDEDIKGGSFAPAVVRMLKSLRTESGRFSEMLISSPNGDAVLQHRPDPFSLMMASSKAEDFEECLELKRQGHDTMSALTLMLRRRGVNA